MQNRTVSLMLLVCAASAGCMASGAREESAAAPSPGASNGGAPQQAGRFAAAPVLLTVDPGARSLGAYELVLRYDPAVARVSAVRQPGPGGFPATPMSDPSTWRSGATPILGFVVGEAPAGRIGVAVIEFERVAEGESSLSVSVRSLYSPDGKPIPGTALLSRSSVGSR